MAHAGTKPDAWYHAFQLIRTLREFSASVQTIYTWNDKQFSADNVLMKVIAEEEHLKQCKENQDSEFHLPWKNKRTSNSHTCR